MKEMEIEVEDGDDQCLAFSMPISKTLFYICLRKRSKSNSVISLCVCVIFVMQIVFSF